MAQFCVHSDFTGWVQHIYFSNVAVVIRLFVILKYLTDEGPQRLPELNTTYEVVSA